mgnify:CR=1 FL=1
MSDFPQQPYVDPQIPQQQQYYGAPPQQQPPPQQYMQQQQYPPQQYAPPQNVMYAPNAPLQQPYMQQQQPPQQQFVQIVQTVPQISGTLLEQVFVPNNKALVKQRIEPFELITGFETENKYDINFENGYKAVALEESTFLSRWLLGASRPFTMHIAFKDNKQEFLTLERPFKFFLHEVTVLDTTNNRAKLGKIKLNCSFCTKEMTVFDEADQAVFKVIGPCCSFWTFYIETLDGQRVGEIKKKWSGFLKEMYTDADNFGVEFPRTATAKQKALLLAATFLIGKCNQHLIRSADLLTFSSLFIQIFCTLKKTTTTTIEIKLLHM